MPAIVSSDASDFSKSVWIRSSDISSRRSYGNGFAATIFQSPDPKSMKILVEAAIEREKLSHPKNEAPYQVLVKALRNQESPGTKVTHAVEIISHNNYIQL